MAVNMLTPPDNVCIFRKIVHKQSGQELEISQLDDGTLIETLELDGPKLLLTFRDTDERIKNQLKIKEYDDLSVSYGDTWRENGVSENEDFTVLSCSPGDGNKYTINAMAKPVYNMKQIADKTRIFAQQGMSAILKSVGNTIKKFEIGKFPVVENYHVVAGERPTTTLRQIASEQGCHIWYARGTMHMEKFATMFAKGPSMTFQHGSIKGQNHIVSYEKPSNQVDGQETSIRSFTGWNEVTGRIKSAPDGPVLKKAKSTPTTITGSSNPFILGNSPVAKQTAIDFVALGNLSVQPGQVLALRWIMADQANPINEGLPPKIVVEAVAHWYSAQKYYIRVKGATALESF